MIRALRRLAPRGWVALVASELPVLEAKLEEAIWDVLPDSKLEPEVPDPLYTGRFLTSHIATSDSCAHGFRCSYHNALMKHISNHNIQSEPALELLTCDRARARSA